MHWHNSLEIAYVISGQINYIVEGINYNLGEDDILWNCFTNIS
ncbi:AraC family ligand binding domain-containing protein [Clostridium sp. CTA-7]